VTNTFDLFGVIIALNLIYFGWVIGFVAGSPKGLSTGAARTPAKRADRLTISIGMIVLGAVYGLASLYRLL